MKACFTKKYPKKIEKNKRTKKRKKYYLRQVLNPGPPTYDLDALPIAPRKPAPNEIVNLT